MSGHDRLHTKILAALAAEPVSDHAFNALALEIYDLQRTHNAIYSAYLDAISAPAPHTWREIPALPAAAFKRAPVTAFPNEQATVWFETSGTTQAETGRHYFRSLELYEAAIIPNFRAHV